MTYAEAIEKLDQLIDRIKCLPQTDALIPILKQIAELEAKLLADDASELEES